MEVNFLYMLHFFSSLQIEAGKIGQETWAISVVWVKLGSTKLVEQNIINMGSKAVAYVNMDCAVKRLSYKK